MNKPIDQIENCLVGLAMLDEIDDRSFELRDFQNSAMLQSGPHACGSAACFGGWVALHPHFQAQGVTSCSAGAPELPGHVVASYVAEDLFGSEEMFYDRRDYGVSQKEEVRQRLLRALDELLA